MCYYNIIEYYDENFNNDNDIVYWENKYKKYKNFYKKFY